MSLKDREAITPLVVKAQAELPRRTRAYEQLVTLIYPDVQRIAYAIVGNMADADQVTQDSLLRVYHKLPTLNAPEAFPKWLSIIVANTANSFHAKEAREREKQRQAAMEAETSYDPSPESHESFHRMIAPLDVVDRTILAMKILQDLEFAEIAEVLSMGLSNTKMRYYRALEKLARR